MARIELEVKNAAGVPIRRIKTFGVGDNLKEESGLAAYEGFIVSEIHVNGYVTFLNGTTIRRGEVIGDTNELNMQRVQIRETIMSHFEKERQLFKRGIKCLSLFFIDEVAKYKSYDEDGNEVRGVFQKMFEEEYSRLVSEEFHIWDEDYNEYLRKFIPKDVHRGYFSIDKKSGRMIDGKVEKKSGLSDDISAYELILKNNLAVIRKEKKLSQAELAKMVGVSRNTISSIETGQFNPTAKLALILCIALDKRFEELFYF
jgi:type III restriction enzyme